MALPLILLILAAASAAALGLVLVSARTVVDTNYAHIVQYSKRTVAYGTGQRGGNVYYYWPSWVPLIGLKRTVIPVNNFNLKLTSHAAYDKDRVPFELDLVAFFRIDDPVMASQRISTFKELTDQLLAVVQGGSRKVLSTYDINQIMTDRATFGQAFTDEVREELKSWGVTPVKNMELMDFRDSGDSKVIHSIMEMKISHINMASRQTVAANNQAAEVAEITAQQAVAMRDQEAKEVVGQRNAARMNAVGVAEQQAQQAINIAAAETTAKKMDVQRVETVRMSEITREAQVIAADQGRQTKVLEAEGALEAAKRAAEATRVKGEAEGAAALAIQMAPVTAQINLAKEIGANEKYQTYLVTLKGYDALTTIGTEQAKALEKADVKVFATAGNPADGINNAANLFTPGGGLNIGGMLTAIGATPEGRTALSSLYGKMNGANGGGTTDKPS